MSFVGCTAVVGLVFACSSLAPGGLLAQTHNTLNFGHVDQQSPSSSAQPTVVTPELLADMMVAHGHYAEAIEAYRKIRPQNAEIYNKIGIAYQRMANDEDAIANYGQATKLDRKYAAPYNNLGTVYFHENDNKRPNNSTRSRSSWTARLHPSGATWVRSISPNTSTATAPKPTRRRSYWIPISSRRSRSTASRRRSRPRSWPKSTSRLRKSMPTLA